MNSWNGVRSGERYAASRWADLLSEQGRLDELRERADAGDGRASRLAEQLAVGGRIDELRQRLVDGDHHAGSYLVRALTERGCIEELEAEARAGTYGVWPALTKLRGEASV